MSTFRDMIDLFEGVNTQIVMETVSDAIEDLKSELLTSDNPLETVADISIDYGVSPEQVKVEFERRFGPIDDWKNSHGRLKKIDAQDKANQEAEASAKVKAASDARSMSAKLSAKTRAEKQQKQRAQLRPLVDALENFIGDSFPDSDWDSAVERVWSKFKINSQDGWDTIWPKLEKQFLEGTSFKNMQEYMANMWDQLAADNPGSDFSKNKNPWRS